MHQAGDSCFFVSSYAKKMSEWGISCEREIEKTEELRHSTREKGANAY